MKKIAVLVLALMLFCAGCKKTEKPAQSTACTKWFDTADGDVLVPDGIREFDSDAFPGVTFRVYDNRVEAVTEKGRVPLYDGMPVLSVYFCDLTGDGKPELCSGLCFGSGICDYRLMIYDYANGVSYELADRGKTDYVLGAENGKLTVSEYQYESTELLGKGTLVFRDGCLQVAK